MLGNPYGANLFGALGSRTVIERCGGVLARTLPAERERDAIRHYWIELQAR